ncbi:MAG: hypothetical protein HC915_17815 [Anaerolineae bacterium]|nr:hypothetical protein [Anaerolineae bacterium]
MQANPMLIRALAPLSLEDCLARLTTRSEDAPAWLADLQVQNDSPGQAATLRRIFRLTWGYPMPVAGYLRAQGAGQTLIALGYSPAVLLGMVLLAALPLVLVNSLTIIVVVLGLGQPLLVAAVWVANFAFALGVAVRFRWRFRRFTQALLDHLEARPLVVIESTGEGLPLTRYGRAANSAAQPRSVPGRAGELRTDPPRPL